MRTPKLNDGKEQAEELYHHVRDKAHEMYEEGKKGVCEVEEHIKEYADDIIGYIKEKPVTSVLIAGGIGFILSALLKHRD